MIKSWINDLNMTSFRVLVSCLLAVSLSHIIVIAMVFYKYEPTKIQMTVLTGILFGILTMMGFETASFLGKRFSDIDFAKAKNPPTQVIASPPSTVEVKGDAVVTHAAPPDSSGTLAGTGEKGNA